ncbi:MAG TPA: cupin domain-containing protein [Sphaerochaeta sp.]|nr:cupin domain-containing protein [Sphaerochaeta sp.]
MYVSHRDTIEGKKISQLVTKQLLVTPEQGWEGHVMRLFTLAPEGAAPRHSHDWEHIIYVLEGDGNLYLEGEDHRLSAGSVAYVPALSDHQVANRGNGDFAFICIVPERGDQ